MRFGMLASLLGVVWMGTAFGRGDSPELESFANEEGGYRVSFTEKKKTDTTTAQSDAGPLTLHATTGSVGKDMVLSITWTDYPDAVAMDDTKKLLDAARDAAKAGKGKVNVDVDSKLNAAVTGREVEISFAKFATRFRAYVVGRRFYVVSITGTKRDVGARWATDYLDSFALLKK